MWFKAKKLFGQLSINKGLLNSCKETTGVNTVLGALRGRSAYLMGEGTK